YVSAEAAARAYLEAFGNADVKTMISTFSVESFANNYDLQAQIERLWAYNFFSLPQSLPSNNRLTTDLNIQRRQGLIANWIQYQYASVFFADDLNNGGAMTPFGDEREVDRFIERISDPTYYEAIQTLSIIDFVDLNSLSDMYSSDKNQQNIDSTSDIVGAQKIENVVARVDIDREIYLFCFDVASYDGRWYINSLGGNIGTLLGISSYNMGVIREIDVP
ncbi:MAG: hypothetical protein FWH57_04110, partial [Oscillospiraceae bacterium]|nr:hypothetical protein [Oscillospiraceae bacterium]